MIVAETMCVFWSTEMSQVNRQSTNTPATITLSRNEWLAIFDVLNGSLNAMLEAGHRLDDRPKGALAFSLEDAKEDGLYEKWRIDGPSLVAKIAAMSAAEVGSIYHASVVFWDMDDGIGTDERVDAVIDRYNSEIDPNHSALLHPLST